MIYEILSIYTMDNVIVNEQQIPFYYNVKSFDIIVTGLQLNTLVNIIARCYDVNNKFLFDQVFVIEGQEYLNWGNNDEYLVDLVCSKLGLTKA